MNRILNIQLNKFPIVPNTLRAAGLLNSAVTQVQCDMARLFHHYYLDSYGRCPPEPNPVNFEYLQFVTSDRDFRFTGDGLGASTAFRRNASTALGQAFCRWFLYEHLNITYFAHMDKVLNGGPLKTFEHCALERVASGDAPDYLCAESTDKVFLAEAKGRYSSISFKSKEFGRWRQQFSRVAFKDPSANLRRVKGFIIATRFATATDSTRVASTISAEDPDSPGDESLSKDGQRVIAAAAISQHYSNVFAKLNQPLLSAAIESQSGIPDELEIRAAVWRLEIGPLKGKRFVGGFWAPPGGVGPYSVVNGNIVQQFPNMFRLDPGSSTFWGVEESIFRTLASNARSGSGDFGGLERFPDTEPFYSAASVLRDGTVLGPAEFFFPVDIIQV